MPRGIDRWDEARLQGRLWTPALCNAAGGNLGLWLDVSDLSTVSVSSGTSISKIADKSGNGRDAVPSNTVTNSQATTAPTLQLSGATTHLGFRALPRIYCNSQSLSGNFLYTGATLNIYIVASMNSNSANNRFFSFGSYGFADFNNTNYCNIQSYNTGYIHYRNGNTNTINLGTDTLSVVEGFDTGSIMFAGGNGADAASSAMTSSFNTTNYRFMEQLSGGGFIVGWFCEALLDVGVYATRRRALIEGYLAWKWWGSANPLVASHPFKLRPPLIGD